ncbi:MAG: hexokinase family protein [Cellulosilyticaceae bacterium]
MKQMVRDFLTKHGMHFEAIDMATACDTFIKEMSNGLDGEASSLAMIPTYLTVENRQYQNESAMVIDAGGTNFRVGLVTFDAEMQPVISDFSKTQMPGIKEELTKKEFFGAFVDHTKEVAKKSQDIGFCFSYPAEIGEDKDATLVRWTKEVKAPEVVGEKIGANLVEGLKELDGKDRSVVILNDTVATLLGGKGITAHRRFDGYIGFIFGTGTNACYMEQVDNIKKLSGSTESTMIINMESGGYNKLPRGVVDEAFDATTANPGDYQFEKMVSGRYLGPVVQEVLHLAAKEGLLSAACNEKLLAIKNCQLIDVSLFMANPHDEANLLVQTIAEDSDRTLLYMIIDAMIERAAKACAMQLSGIIIKTNTGLDPAKPVAIVAEGTTFYKLKDYKEKLDFYMKEFLVKNHGRHYEFLQGEDLNLIGTAIAALSNK